MGMMNFPHETKKVSRTRVMFASGAYKQAGMLCCDIFCTSVEKFYLWRRLFVYRGCFGFDSMKLGKHKHAVRCG